MDVDRFMRGFDLPLWKPPARREGADPIFEELDALREERGRRNDPCWQPRGPAGMERLVEERRARLGRA